MVGTFFARRGSGDGVRVRYRTPPCPRRSPNAEAAALLIELGHPPPASRGDHEAVHDKFRVTRRRSTDLEPNETAGQRVGAAGFEPATARVLSACETSHEPSTCNDRSNLPPPATFDTGRCRGFASRHVSRRAIRATRAGPGPRLELHYLGRRTNTRSLMSTSARLMASGSSASSSCAISITTLA